MGKKKSKIIASLEKIRCVACGHETISPEYFSDEVLASLPKGLKPFYHYCKTCGHVSSDLHIVEGYSSLYLLAGDNCEIAAHYDKKEMYVYKIDLLSKDIEGGNNASK